MKRKIMQVFLVRENPDIIELLQIGLIDSISAALEINDTPIKISITPTSPSPLNKVETPPTNIL